MHRSSSFRAFSSIAALAAAVLLPAAPADADPRWWTHDRAITTSAEDKSNPDVAYVDGQGAVGGAIAIVAVWEQPSSLAVGQDIWLSASFDGGCTWCAPREWAADAASETYPRVQAGAHGGRLSIQVVYQRGAQVFVSGDASVDVNDPDLCRSLSVVPLPTPTLLSRPIAPGDEDSRPRIAKATDGFSFTHFHVAWQRLSGFGPSVEYANDKSGLGSMWTTGVDLTPLIMTAGEMPDIAADAVPQPESGVSIYFREPGGSQVLMTRSGNSGTGWDTPPVLVSAAAQATAPSADSATSPFGDFGPAWGGVAWPEENAPHDITYDGARWTGPLSRDPDFETPGDVAVSDSADTPGSDQALVMAPAFGPAGPADVIPQFVFWNDEAAAPAELVLRGGELDHNRIPPRDFDAPPLLRMAPQARLAPPDPTVSVVERFTSCVWDDDWPTMAAGTCVPVARAGGTGATAVAGDGGLNFIDLPATFVTVFSDDRDGTSQVYFKRTDGSTVPPTILNVTTTCTDLRTAGVAVEFEPPAVCPTVGSSGPEWLDRVLLYYGPEPTTSAQGPFPGRAEAAMPTLTINADDLDASSTYHLFLLFEDEARNLSPLNFNPNDSINRPTSSAQTAMVDTFTCAPNVDLINCAYVESECDMMTHTNPPRPGDTVTVTLTLDNTLGEFDASNVSGTVTATNATVVNPPAGDFSGIFLGIGMSQDLTVTLRVDPAPPTCPGPTTIEVDIVNLRSDESHPKGPVTYGMKSCVSPFLDVDCSGTCDAGGCLVGDLSRINPVKGYKSAPNLTFTWPVDPNAAEYHVNTVPSKMDLVDPRVAPTGNGTTACTTASLTCELPCLPDLVTYYQVLSACGASGTEEGPF